MTKMTKDKILELAVTWSSLSSRASQAFDALHNALSEAFPEAPLPPEPLCPLCNRSIYATPCSMNSDGAHHVTHPHNAGPALGGANKAGGMIF